MQWVHSTQKILVQKSQLTQLGYAVGVQYTVGMQYTVGTHYAVGLGAKGSTHTIHLANMGGGDCNL